jgi:hypothetical protein
MVAPRILYLAVRLIAINNDPLNVGVRNFVWRYIINTSINFV